MLFTPKDSDFKSKAAEAYRYGEYLTTIVVSPTANCQLFSVAYASPIIKEGENFFANFLKKAHSMTEKPYCLLDLIEEDANTLKSWKRWEIKGEIPYYSITGSNMVTIIIDVN